MPTTITGRVPSEPVRTRDTSRIEAAFLLLEGDGYAGMRLRLEGDAQLGTGTLELDGDTKLAIVTKRVAEVVS